MKKAVFICLGLLLVVLAFLILLLEPQTLTNVTLGICAFSIGIFSVHIGTQWD